MNLSLVAYYGEKPEDVSNFVTEVQNIITLQLGVIFDKYSLAQVHGTIIGLEGTRAGNHILNTNYIEHRKQLRAINFHRLFEILKNPSLFPLTISIGGYKDGASYPFTSRGQHPYLRSFSIQGDIVLAIGWPYTDNKYPLTIDRLRRSLNKANILHRYHAEINDIDNDFFFVLGRINREHVEENILYETQNIVRDFLMSNNILTSIGRDNLSIVAYIDTKLPLDTSRVYGLDEAEGKIDEIKNLYDEMPASQ